MQFSSLRLYLFAVACVFLAGGVSAQIAGTTDAVGTTYTGKGMTDQPFTVEVIDARRTVSNSLLVRLALTNHGAEAIGPSMISPATAIPPMRTRFPRFMPSIPTARRNTPSCATRPGVRCVRGSSPN